jgi:subtilisin family serine protease
LRGAARARRSPSARLADLLTPRFTSTSLTRSPTAEAASFLLELAPGEDARTLGLFEMAPGIASGRSTLRARPVPRETRRRISVTPRTRATLDVSRERSGVPAFVEATAGTGKGKGKGVVVGSSTPASLSHPCLRRRRQVAHRVAALPGVLREAFTPESKSAWCTDPAQSPCAVFSADDFPNGDLAEDLHDFVGHGTHVTSIAAGNGMRNSEPAHPAEVRGHRARGHHRLCRAVAEPVASPTTDHPRYQVRLRSRRGDG